MKREPPEDGPLDVAIGWNMVKPRAISSLQPGILKPNLFGLFWNDPPIFRKSLTRMDLIYLKFQQMRPPSLNISTASEHFFNKKTCFFLDLSMISTGPLRPPSKRARSPAVGEVGPQRCFGNGSILLGPFSEELNIIEHPFSIYFTVCTILYQGFWPIPISWVVYFVACQMVIQVFLEQLVNGGLFWFVSPRIG